MCRIFHEHEFQNATLGPAEDTEAVPDKKWLEHRNWGHAAMPARPIKAALGEFTILRAVSAGAVSNSVAIRTKRQLTLTALSIGLSLNHCAYALTG